LNSNKDENSGFQRRVNPLILFEGPLFTLQSIKNDWINHPRTCLKISSADILQFAIFFATTRQKDTPESLLLPSGNLLVPPPPSTAVAKRETLKNEFLWGRPDETKCNPEWAENLPSSNTFACNNNIPCRCATAGGEIEEKMMKRNGFTAGKFQLFDLLNMYYTRDLTLFSPLHRGSNCINWRSYHRIAP
jgi:hypothetical protein